MLHALRNQARDDREAGFTLIEILVAMVLMAIIMSSIAVFFIGAQKSSSALRGRQNATVIADQAMETVHSFQTSQLITGRDATSVAAQYNATKGTNPSIAGVDVSTMVTTPPLSDLTAAAGAGATANLPTSPVAGLQQKVDGTQFRVNYIVGLCYIPHGGGDCGAVKHALDDVPMDRVVVAVNWTSPRSSCPGNTCAYVVASLINTLGDPTFNINQVLVDTTPPSTPSGLNCTGDSDQTVALAKWNASTDASGIGRYDIWRGTQPDFGSMGKIGTSTTPSAFEDTGRTPGTTYYYVVVALDTVGNQSGPQVPNGTVTSPQEPYVASCTTLPDTTPPGPVGNLTAVPSTNSVMLTWTAATDDYQVQQYLVSRNGTQVGTVSAGVNTFTDTGLSPWTNYTYTVTTMDAVPADNLTKTSQIPSVATKTTDNVPPSAVTGFAGVVDGTNKTQLDLDWADSTDDVAVVGYKVCRSTSSTMSSPTCSTVGTSSKQDSGLSSNSTYYYTVSAYDAAGNYSAVPANGAAVSTPDSIAPSAPGTVTVGAKTSSSLVLSWAAATDNPGGTGVKTYTIYRNGAQVGTVTSPTVTYTDTGLAGDTSYSYTVTATDGGIPTANVGPASTAAAFTTLPTSSSLSSSAKTYTTVALNWTSAGNAGVTNYALYRGGSLIATLGATTYTYTDSGRTAGTAYSYTVKAYDAAGNYSAASNTLAVTTYTTPVLSGSSGSIGSTVISWTPTSDVVSVITYKLLGGTTGTTSLYSNSGTSFTYSGLAANKTYLLTVTATDTAGLVSPVSNTLTCTTDGSGKVTCS